MKYFILFAIVGFISTAFLPTDGDIHATKIFSEQTAQDTNKKKKRRHKRRRKRKRLSDLQHTENQDNELNDENIEIYEEENKEIQEADTTQPEVHQPTPEELKARQDSIRKSRRNPRDSVPPAPMSHEELRSAIQTKKYRRNDLSTYKDMRRRLEELRDLRDKSSWLVKQQRWELDDAGLKKSMETAFQIRSSYSILENEIQELELKKGKNAMQKFRNLVVDDVYNIENRRVNREVLEELKADLFFSKEKPQLLCQGGVGRILGSFKGKIDGSQGCRGYVSSLSNNPEFNLIIMLLDDGTKVAVIIDKNANSASHGALGVF